MKKHALMLITLGVAWIAKAVWPEKVVTSGAGVASPAEPAPSK